MKTQRIPFLLVLWIIGLGTCSHHRPRQVRAAPGSGGQKSCVAIGVSRPDRLDRKDIAARAGIPAVASAHRSAAGKSLPATIGGFESFVAANPNAAWTPSLKANPGYFYYQSGRYTLALSHWETAWDQAKGMQDRWGKHVADYSLAHWTRLLASLGREEELAKIFKETKDRALDRGPLSQKFGPLEATMAMRTPPRGIIQMREPTRFTTSRLALQVP